MNKNILYYFFIVFSFTFIKVTIYSQPKSLQFKHITADDGLSSSTIMCIYQDYMGFLWIGTYDGLNRYDGKHFVIYKTDPDDPHSLSYNAVRTIYEDKNKNLFFGTLQGLCLYDRNNDYFIDFNREENSPFKNTRFTILKIVEDSINNLWLATNYGLVYFDRKNNRIKQYSYDPNNPKSISFDLVESILIDKKNRFWITTRKGLNIFNPKAEIYNHITSTKNGRDITGTYFSEMIEDNEGNIWFGSQTGLYCCENTSDKNDIQIAHYQHDPNDETSISTNWVKSFCIDNEGYFWIGTDNGGVNLYDKNNNRFWHYGIDEYNPKSLNNESVQVIYQDKTENLWIGTFAGGINVASKYDQGIVSFTKLRGAPESLSHPAVTCFIEDSKKRIWLGTDGGGLNLFNDKTNKFIHYDMNNSDISSNAIIDLAEDSDQNLWLGTWAGDLICFKSNQKKFISYSKEKDGLQDNNIFAIEVDDNDDLWLGSFENGLIHFIKKENRFINYDSRNSEVKTNMIIVIKKDSKGRLFLGEVNMLHIFDPKDESFVTYEFNPDDSNSLCHPSVRDILIQNDSMVWIATQEGLNLFNPLTNNFKRYTIEDGLPNNVINGLTLDHSEILWVTTNHGVCKFDYINNTYTNFTKDDGLQSNEFIQRSAFTRSDGAILIGGTKGFNIIYPEKIIKNLNIPKILITDLHIFNSPVKIGIKGSPLTKQISLTKEITLDYDQSVLTFYFSSMDFTIPEKNEYKYMMENFDKDWIYSGNRGEATYTNLNPGDYIFRVKGSNNDGIWNEEGVALKITILPPWYDTFWFKFGLAGLLIFITLSIYKLRVRILKQQQHVLENKVRERTEELSQTNALLEEKQEEIIMQNAQLKESQEELKATNSILEEKQEEITIQNAELAKHRNNLEQLINERTAELEEAKVHAEQSDRLKTAFLANMSHEIRTPMNAIVGFSSLLKTQGIDESEKEFFINSINSNCDSLLVLIDDLLEISLIESNQVSIKKSLFDVDMVLNELENYFQIKNEKNIEITFVKPPGKQKLIINNDSTRFKQIIINLLSNALKYTEKGFIKFGYEILMNQARFFVSDSGIGIDKQEFDSIFDHFHKIEDTKTKIYRGAGLGLTICKNLVELMGGNIWLESEIGKGTTFYLSLPHEYQSTMKEYKIVTEEIENPALENIKILIAEDEPMNFQLLKKIFQPTKAQIIWTKDGKETVDFMEKVTETENMILLLDIKMPVMNGIEALKIIRKKHKNIPAIAITAYAHETDKSEILENGFDDYIAKPIKVESLFGIVKKYISQ